MNKTFLEDKLQARPGYKLLARNKALEQGHHAVQDLCALSEIQRRTDSPFCERACPTSVPSLLPWSCPKSELPAGGPSLATAGAADAESVEPVLALCCG